ncbi:MAG: OmpH family outer membrane protein [Bacteroidales bacterium]|nr:OmpH family outer membrane protein [Bacteroidales bacterium]
MEEELIENVETEIVQPESQKKSCCCSCIVIKLCNIISSSVLLVAVIVLYILHFITPKTHVFFPKEIVGEPGSGEIVFVNLDTINENYDLVMILNGDIRAEMAKQDAIFAKRENDFKNSYNIFQENASAGILTQVQMEYAQNKLAQEYQQLEADKERVYDELQARQAVALYQIYDSLHAAVSRINTIRNASFVITYQNQTPFLLYTDPSKDITDHVLFELNRSYKK